ncbi:MAG: hypothetical protein V1854_02110 [Methanobacteriota archaeon]
MNAGQRAFTPPSKAVTKTGGIRCRTEGESAKESAGIIAKREPGMKPKAQKVDNCGEGAGFLST